MEIPQVEAFLAVGTFGGFRRAAEALRITQPAVSARIRALEESLNVRLFERGAHGLALSAAGRVLRPHAEQLLRAVALARQAVHDLRPASGGALQIAAVLSICTYLLPDVLKRFQAAYPKVLITVRSGHSKEVLEMVLRAEAEIGLARSLHHPEVETVSLRDDPLILVARPAAWPGRERRARPAEVAGLTRVLFDPGASDADARARVEPDAPEAAEVVGDDVPRRRPVGLRRDARPARRLVTPPGLKRPGADTDVADPPPERLGGVDRVREPPETDHVPTLAIVGIGVEEVVRDVLHGRVDLAPRQLSHPGVRVRERRVGVDVRERDLLPRQDRDPPAESR